MQLTFTHQSNQPMALCVSKMLKRFKWWPKSTPNIESSSNDSPQADLIANRKCAVIECRQSSRRCVTPLTADRQLQCAKTVRRRCSSRCPMQFVNGVWCNLRGESINSHLLFEWEAEATDIPNQPAHTTRLLFHKSISKSITIYHIGSSVFLLRRRRFPEIFVSMFLLFWHLVLFPICSRKFTLAKTVIHRSSAKQCVTHYRIFCKMASMRAVDGRSALCECKYVSTSNARDATRPNRRVIKYGIPGMCCADWNRIKYTFFL